tara:strand:+ start:251 stop:481 length:231 start_codon:yes stop_codon:yes gene_type:complete
MAPAPLVLQWYPAYASVAYSEHIAPYEMVVWGLPVQLVPAKEVTPTGVFIPVKASAANVAATMMFDELEEMGVIVR